jgi:hypothetical protein
MSSQHQVTLVASAALGRILGQSAAADILSTARANWQQHTVAALTDYRFVSAI